jgi:Tfp pilus assembly protein PilF/predicted AlkP superfamily pyrophosphatase or phosphodiesterase
MTRPAGSRWTRALVVLAAAAAVAFPALSCSRGEKPGRVIVLGLDGADPATIDLLMSEGKLPHFAKLRREGAYAPLASQKPLLSPVIWTTIATGKTPDRHRIGHFVAVNAATGESLPVTSRMRRTRAIWNILSGAGRSVDVVGWWATWPAEAVRGEVVSDHYAYHFLMEEAALSPPRDSRPGTTYPAQLEAELAPLRKRPDQLTPAELAAFVSVSPAEVDRPFDFDDDLSHFKWALATAETYSAIGLRLWETQRPTNLLVYIEGLDSTSHLFGHLFRAGPLSGELAQQQRRYGNAVEQMYVYADRLLGRFLDAMDGETTLVVLSDHGFQLGKLQDDPSKTRDMRRVSEAFHTIDGILYLYGRHVRPHTRLNRPTILDVTPTVLALNGLGRGSDMPGRVLAEGLDLTVPAPVPTYETTPAGPAQTAAADPRADPEIVKKLQSLGYIGARSPTGDRNLAGLAFEAGRYAEAAAAYEKLIRENPKDGALRASHAGALGALGRYDEALEELDEAIALEPLNVEAYHNRAVIHERRQDRTAAVSDYQTAVRYNPQYEPSLRALVRLGAPLPQAPRSDEERRALGLADEAARAARRADYDEAARKLDAAERIAPRLALIQQYRANVAYLRGDRTAAIAALKRALAIEPDNALFRENLKRLETPAPR